jgi:glycosyltransferase involved in cell wall biosynthesis
MLPRLQSVGAIICIRHAEQILARDWALPIDQPQIDRSPLVSVVIPSFNAAATLERAIASVRAQTYRPLEIIVVDDGSSDSTPELLQRFAGPDLIIIRNPKPSGAANARNQGIQRATGELVAFLDADDEWFPNKLALQVPALLANPAATFAACGGGVIDLDGRYSPDQYPGVQKVGGPEAWRAILRANFIATPSVLAWRKALLDAGLFDVNLRVAEDQDMWIKLAVAGELVYLDRPLIVIHEQPSSLTGGQPRIKLQETYTLPMLHRHLERLKDRIDRREYRRILAERYARIGRGAYVETPRQALRFLLRGSLYGYQPLQNLVFSLTSSAFGRWLRKHLP